MMKVYTEQTAAELLSVPEDTIREWARSGQLRGSRLNEAWRFTEADIREFLAAHRSAPAPEAAENPARSRRQGWNDKF